MSALLDWFDHRTGYRDFVRDMLYENIPGGSRYRYVWGSTLVFTFAVQVITGIFLWMAYSPSAQSAWESVYHIQHNMQGGWLLRGLHHFTAQAMIVLLALHLVQVVIDGAYRAPREINFWIGLVLMQLVLGLALTGYLLPWDQKGYWATRVATNIAGSVPIVGDAIQRLIVGGGSYGHHTLTRFFALHAGVLPGLLVVFLVLHVYLFRRHGIKAKDASRRPDATFWPDQVLKDGVACLAVLAVVLFFIVRHAAFGATAGDWSASNLGAELGSPADASSRYDAARPEWYFLFLFQMLKYFSGDQELIGTIVIPGTVMFLLFMMPLWGRWRLGHGFNIGLVAALLGGVGYLTFDAIREDRGKPEFKEAVRSTEETAERMVELIGGYGGIPATGALTLLREDPKTQGPRLFARHCASCHVHTDSDEQPQEATAPELTGIGSRGWLEGLFDPKQVAGPKYFGNTKHVEGDMAGYVGDTVADLDAEGRANLAKVIAAISAEAALSSQREADLRDTQHIAEGRQLMTDYEFDCLSCHRLGEEGELGTAPDLTGWGSAAWMAGMISDPNHQRYYGYNEGNNDRMPAFASSPDKPEENILTPNELALIVDWLRGDWYVGESETGDD